jgi:arsenate reductase (glutaredoxin)
MTRIKHGRKQNDSGEDICAENRYLSESGIMGIQIFGTLKCQETRKAQRYFKDRGIPFQFINLAEKGFSKGELNSIKAIAGIENLIDKDSKEYSRLNLKYLTHNVEEELLKHPLLCRTPIVRDGRKATVGYMPEDWKEWI